MRKLLFAMLGVLVLAGCNSSDDSMKCGPYDVMVQYHEDTDTLSATLNGDAVDLTHVMSASGARYDGILNDTQVTLWNKGKDWTLFLNDDEPIECK